MFGIVENFIDILFIEKRKTKEENLKDLSIINLF